MFETDQAALARVIDGPANTLLAAGQSLAAEPTPYSVFFLYMRLNGNGTFEARQYYHEGNATDAIGPSPVYDPIAKTMGYYVKEMALNARTMGTAFPVHGEGVDIHFPRRFSYCVFFMDDLYWRFLTQTVGGSELPIVTFKEEKNGTHYTVHDHAFWRLPLVEMEMPNRYTTAGVDIRQAAVMVNRMRNGQDVSLGTGEQEDFCFDFPMRVRYGSTTNGLTLIIDPTGTNLGPPDPPPEE